jgi:hypothetical protein
LPVPKYTGIQQMMSPKDAPTPVEIRPTTGPADEGGTITDPPGGTSVGQ